MIYSKVIPKNMVGPDNTGQVDLQTQWHSGRIAGLSAGRHGVQSSIPGRGE